MHDVNYVNPSVDYMQGLIKQQEEENRRMLEEIDKLKNDDGNFGNIANRAQRELEGLKAKIIPHFIAGGGGIAGGAGGGDAFPEDFVFRQNEFRNDDLGMEESALVNLAAQEYDALRLLSRLPVNSELYRYKMDQYKELSSMRSEIEKVLQE